MKGNQGLIHEVSKDFSRLGKFILAALTLGIIFGMLEGTWIWLHFLAGETVPADHEITWSTPLVYGVIFLLLGAVIGTLYVLFTLIMSKGRFRPIMMPLVDMLCFFGILVVLSVILSAAAWARVVLAAGLTFQTHQWLIRRKRGAIDYLAGKALPVALAVAGIFFITTLLQRGNALLRTAQLPPAREDAPNVILVIIDTLRADHLSTYGYSRPTPNIDQIAREGIQFDYVLSTAPWTLPSFSTMMTGLYSYEHKADKVIGARLDDRFLTLAEAFSQNGYQTAGFVANFNYSMRSKGLAQGFNEYNDILWSFEDMLRLTTIGFYLSTYIRLSEDFGWHYLGRKSAEEINREFMDWLPEQDSRPFFVWLNYFDTHDPYFSGSTHSNPYGNELASGNPGSFGLNGASFYGQELSPEETQAQLDAYDNSINYTDRQLEVLFSFLKQRGMFDNSIIVVTSDHGEAFGEHKFYGHGNSLYREALHVPLIIRYPKLIPAGQRISQPVSLQRLAVTIQDLAQLQLEKDFPGISLLDDSGNETLLLSERAYDSGYPESHPISKGDMVSFTTDDWHVIFTGGQAEAYKLTDFLDEVDIASTSKAVSVIAIFRQMLTQLGSTQK